jgi:hypothetical protein
MRRRDVEVEWREPLKEPLQEPIWNASSAYGTAVSTLRGTTADDPDALDEEALLLEGEYERPLVDMLDASEVLLVLRAADDGDGVSSAGKSKVASFIDPAAAQGAADRRPAPLATEPLSNDLPETSSTSSYESKEEWFRFVSPVVYELVGCAED